MSTRPKNPAEMQRPRRRFGDVIRTLACCPLCREFPDGRPEWTLRVVAYRARTVRVECPACGLRFSFGGQAFLDALDRAPDDFLPYFADAVYDRHRPETD
jgi:hypothetical protein